jgi:hypothetical protein
MRIHYSKIRSSTVNEHTSWSSPPSSISACQLRLRSYRSITPDLDNNRVSTCTHAESIGRRFQWVESGNIERFYTPRSSCLLIEHPWLWPLQEESRPTLVLNSLSWTLKPRPFSTSLRMLSTKHNVTKAHFSFNMTSFLGIFKRVWLIAHSVANLLIIQNLAFAEHKPWRYRSWRRNGLY